MTPNTDNIVINNVQDTIEQTSKTYYLKILFQNFVMVLMQ